jgi:hypothetical protein
VSRVGSTVVLLLLVGLPSGAKEPFVITEVDVGLFRGRAPSDPCEFDQLRQAGVRTLLETRAFLPWASAREASLAADRGMDHILYRWPAMPWTTHQVEAIYQILLRKELYPLYVHCNSSRDRTSLIIALYRVRQQGWPPQDAYDEMLRFRMRRFFWYYRVYFWENAYGPGYPAQRPAHEDCASPG